MSWVVRVVCPSGGVRYLSADQREVEFTQDAEKYADADKAQTAADAYLDIARKCWPCPPMVGVMDEDEEG